MKIDVPARLTFTDEDVTILCFTTDDLAQIRKDLTAAIRAAHAKDNLAMCALLRSIAERLGLSQVVDVRIGRVTGGVVNELRITGDVSTPLARGQGMIDIIKEGLAGDDAACRRACELFLYNTDGHKGNRPFLAIYWHPLLNPIQEKPE